MTYAAPYWPKHSLFMLVQLASTITISQHATHEQKLKAVTDGIGQSHCQRLSGLYKERRNTPSIRPSPKSSASQLFSSQRSAWSNLFWETCCFIQASLRCETLDVALIHHVLSLFTHRLLLNEWKCIDFKCVRKQTKSWFGLTHHANKSSRWAE